MIPKDLSKLAAPMDSFKRIEIARGYFDDIEYHPGLLTATGWMLLQGSRIDAIHAYINGEPAAVSPPVYRPDVARELSRIKDAGYSGFSFQLPYEATADGNYGWLDLIGYRADRPVCQMNILFHTNIEAVEPTPNPDLMYRVVNNRDKRAFKTSGAKSFGEFLKPILQYVEPNALHTMLDWGCGCGRMTIHFLALGDNFKVHGCDIDAEAVSWCRENLSAGKFAAIQPYPPTPYADSSFDVIIGLSVLTHLKREAQNAWLLEMRRLLSPGGIFLASVHGKSVAGDEIPGRMQDLLRKGILDDIGDSTLNGIAPEGYYRGVFQTREYTLREWSKYFEILDYVKRGVGNRQDLVIMRTPSNLVEATASTIRRGTPLEAALREGAALSLQDDLSERISALETETVALREALDRISGKAGTPKGGDEYPRRWKQNAKGMIRLLAGPAWPLIRKIFRRH